MKRSAQAWVTIGVAACLALACGSEEDPASNSENNEAGVLAPGVDAGSPPPLGTSDASSVGPGPVTRTDAASVSPSGDGGSSTTPAAGDGGAPDASRSDASTRPPDPGGPVDGDPSKPMVSVPGVPCGAPRGTPPTIKIGGRDVVIAYPCAHEGAAVTFLFTLHGTLQEAQKFSFTLNAGPFHRLADSHNVIYALPKAIGTQWGNGDNGADLPHIFEVIDWVYTTFGEKFRIRSMWAQGGSWGAFYLGSTLACHERLKDRLNGVRMVVGGGCPACSDRLACIVAQQELELGKMMQLTPEQREMAVDKANIAKYATSKGCQAKQGPMDVGNTKHWVFPGCNPGWAYSYYLGPGEHAAPWDPVAIQKTMEEMKSIE
jgi:hypothetical protein